MKVVDFNAIPSLVCEVHGVLDSFPCPWPGCANGLREEAFRQRSMLEGKDGFVFRRFHWKSPLEGEYFGWEKESWPHWFSLRRTFWNEVRRLKLIPASNVEVIYHYTSMEALVNMVESNSIWLSDYSYLNDKTELLHGVNVVAQAAKEFLQAGLSKNQSDLLNSWLDASSNSLPRVCVASFSEDGDGLSQWRAYGNVAIGFDPQKIAIHASQSQIGRVHYDAETQKRLAKVYISHALQAYESDMGKNALERIPDVYHRFSQVLEVVAFFKDSSFRDEREYRLAYVEHPELFKSDTFGEPPPKHFRVKKGRIYSHIVSSELFPIPESKWPLGIREIVLGPESDDLMEVGVREFLDERGLQGVPIRRSVIPYRT